MSIFDPFRIKKPNTYVSKNGQVIRIKPYDQLCAISPRDIQKAKDILKSVGQWPPDPSPPIPLPDNTFVVSETIGLLSVSNYMQIEGTQPINFRDVLTSQAAKIKTNMMFQQLDIFDYDPANILDIAWRFKIHTYIFELQELQSWGHEQPGFQIPNNTMVYTQGILPADSVNNLVLLQATSDFDYYSLIESIAGADQVHIRNYQFQQLPGGAGCLSDIYYSGQDALNFYNYIKDPEQQENPAPSNVVLVVKTLSPIGRKVSISFSANLTIKVKNE